jgi:hypothetical protein
MFAVWLGAVTSASPATAAAINLAAFGPAAFSDSFASLPLGPVAAPLVRSGRTYTTNAGAFKLQQLSGPETRSLYAEPPVGSSGEWYIDVALAAPAFRAGLSIGATQTYIGTVTFFDAAANVLGLVNTPFTPGGDLQFVGWQTTGAPIARMRAEAKPFTRARITNVISEIPEPRALTVALAAAVAWPASRRLAARPPRRTQPSPAASRSPAREPASPPLH